MAGYQIKQLDRQAFAQHKLTFRYTTTSYYEVIRDPDQVFSIQLVKRELGEEIEKEFEEVLFADYLENPSSYALYLGNEIAGYLEIAPETWHNRLRVTELLILPEYRRQGYATALLAKAKQMMQAGGFRELILETQSCNTHAIDCYLKNGFQVIGLDLSCYSNEDIAKKEVRLEMAWR